MEDTEPPDPIENLADLAREFHHLRSEHEREAAHSATRRRLRRAMKQLEQRFAHGVAHWIRDEELRMAWEAHFHRGADRPDAPRYAAPPLFRGRTEAGTAIEVRAATSGGYDIWLDGARAEHQEIRWDLACEGGDPVQIGAWTCTETFESPDAAIASLRTFAQHPGSAPPWAWAPELLEDGLVDANFAITPRGARRLGLSMQAAAAADSPVCVIVIDRARARIFALVHKEDSALHPLEEIAATSNAEERTRDAEYFSDTHPGVQREGPGVPMHAANDRRERHREEHTRRFVERVLDDAARTWERLGAHTIVLVANRRMLGRLRPAMARHLRNHERAYRVVEHPAELTWLDAPALHATLAATGLLPPPGRHAPRAPMRTPNPWQKT